jgi:arylsulfatase A-like enzyme
MDDFKRREHSMKTFTRRTALKGMVGAVAAAPGFLRAARRAGDKPNLLLVWTDQQRADTMAVYGNHRYRVPAMNQLASRSVVFEKCYVTQPVCTPSRSTVMTGLYPHQNGCTKNNIPLRPDTKTLPELLGDSAYRTAYMGKWHLGDEVFAQHGFQEWVSIEDLYFEHFTGGRDRSARSSYHHFLLGQGYEMDEPEEGVFSRDFAVQLPPQHCKASFLANEACNFIFRNRRTPWMLSVNFLEPHPPYSGPYNDLHDEEEAPLPRNYPGTEVEREPAWYSKLREKQRAILERKTLSSESFGPAGSESRLKAGFQRLNRNYAGLCNQVDQSLARILWSLETSGQADNTIILFTSDHGEMGGSHSLIQKTVVYEEAMWVPLLLHVPFRQNRQISVRRPVSQIDIVPTLLALLTGRTVEGLPGQSWTGMLSGDRKLGEDHVFLQWHDPEGGPSWRMVISPEGRKLALLEGDNSVFFNRDRDPLEMSNLFYRPGHAGEIRTLRGQIERWQRNTGDSFPLGSDRDYS